MDFDYSPRTNELRERLLSFMITPVLEVMPSFEAQSSPPVISASVQRLRQAPDRHV